MPVKILKLSEEVINQIAAGEVVENPASIVKELIENSLDAGAKRIAVAIEGGGILSIEVEDDGCGMGREDAKNCLERHATSKVCFLEDLDTLQTMGFRGEALAAIASVSHLSLKTSDGVEGTSIEAQGGVVASLLPCARNRGTTIAVRSLFFNTPARKKFLKSASANSASVRRIVETLALAHPEIAFSLKVQGAVLLDVKPEDLKQRVEGILGVMPISISSDSFSVKGFLASPDSAKSHRREQYVFINRRPIFSPIISKAVKRGYGTRLNEDSHPGFVLFLTIDPSEVDVNVHPQKKEVRFADEKKVFSLFEWSVREAFEQPMESFSYPLSFTTPSFSLKEEEPLPWMETQVFFTPLSFDLPVMERPILAVDHFLLLEREGFLCIDLRRAHARVLAENLREKKGDVQSLLVPLEITLSDEAMMDQLAGLGIECRMIGRDQAAIDALPSWLEPASFDQFFKSLQKGQTIDEASVHYCSGLKKKYSLQEGLALWKALQDCREKRWDPLFRPISVKLETKHWESLFEVCLEN